MIVTTQPDVLYPRAHIVIREDGDKLHCACGIWIWREKASDSARVTCPGCRRNR